VTGFAPRRWGWSALSESGVTATLTIAEPGLHTIYLWVREDGFRLDRLLLTLDGQYVPAGGGPPESPRAGDLAGSLPLIADAGLNSWFTVKETGVAGPAAAYQRNQLGAVAARILLDPGFLLAGPLGLLAPFAYSRRRRRQVQLITVVVAVLVLFGVGWALAYGAGLGGELGADLPFVPLPSERLNPQVQESAAIGNHQALLNLAQQSSQLRTISYSYDPLYRLTGAAYSSGESFAYSYDAAGNRLTEQVNGGPATDYVYDAANRLIQVETQAYSYDNNGNLLNDGQYSYSYDSANRLSRIEDGISTLQYLYNGDGVRVAEIMDGLRSDFVQDVNRPLPQLLTSRQGGTVTQYLHGLGLIGEEKGGTGPMAGPAVWQYTLADAIGSVRQLTDAQGQTTMAQHFDPFGNVMSAASNATTTFGFAGEEQDPTTGLVHLRARTYNPATGRFLQQDTVFGDPGQPLQLCFQQPNYLY
jgi:RHS repeat-associated protein